MSEWQTSMVLTQAQSLSLQGTVLGPGIRVWDGFRKLFVMGDGEATGGIVIGPISVEPGGSGGPALIEGQANSQSFLSDVKNGVSPAILIAGPSTTNNDDSFPDYFIPLAQGAGSGAISKTGAAGQTFASLLSSTGTIIAANAPLLIVDCGYFINELRAPSNGGRSIAAGEADLRSFLTQYRAQRGVGSYAIAIMSPNTTLPNGGLSDPTLAPALNPANLAIAAAICREVAADYNCLFYDRFNAFPVPYGLPWSDGIHPLGPFSKAIAGGLYEALFPASYRTTSVSGSYLGIVSASQGPGAYPEGTSYAFTGSGFPIPGLVVTQKAPSTGLPYPLVTQTVYGVSVDLYYGVSSTRVAGAANSVGLGWQQWGYAGKGEARAVIVSAPWVRPGDSGSNPAVSQVDGERGTVRGTLDKTGNATIAAGETLCSVVYGMPQYDAVVSISVFDGATWEIVPAKVTPTGDLIALKASAIGVNRVHLNASWKRDG